MGSPAEGPSNHVTRISSGDRKINTKFFLTEQPGLDLMGLDLLDELGLLKWKTKCLYQLLLWQKKLKRNRQTDPPETVTRIEAKTQADFDQINIEKDIINGFPSVFLDSLGRCTKMKAKLFPKQNVEPFFRQKQPVPFSALCCAEEELSRLFGYAQIFLLILMPL